jgi:VCBS repeat-containing protein
MTTTYFSLATGNFLQNWSNTGAIATNDDWSGIPSIVGYRTGDVTSSTSVDARTIVTDTGFLQQVLANQFPTATSGGVLEVDRISSGTINPTIAMQGSNANDYAAIVLYLNATARQDLTLTANIRDLDASTDDALQQVVVQYRIGNSGNWTNVAYFADVTTAGSATQVTALSVVLPEAANNQAEVQVRILTTNAAGNDELVGIDDIVVSSVTYVPVEHGTLSIADASVAEGESGTAALTFTVERSGGSAGAVSATWTVTPGTANAADLAAGQPLTGTVNFANGQATATITLLVAGDTAYENDESLTVTLSAATGGANLGDSSAIGAIVNDDPLPPLPPVGDTFINEIHYDNTSGDVGEAIEIAAPAGTDLAGWTLVLYNGSNGPDAAVVYNSRTLSGIVPDQDDGYGTLSFSYPVNGIQNGDFDGIALVDPSGHVIQFISYEGEITAANGPAVGLTSTDIGVSEGGSGAIGLSMQLTGTGAAYGDFHWTEAAPGSFGAVNGGQDFIGRTATGLVSIGDASVVEGDDGVSYMVFTVSRAGGLGQQASVDVAIELTGTSDGDIGHADFPDFTDTEPFFAHVDFAPGVFSVEIKVAIAGDTVGEPNETFQARLVNVTGNIAVVDGIAVGTILNDDPIPLHIYEIQGAAHRSPYEGQPVITHGIVTGVTSNGFYLQDAAGDANDATSDALFVFTGAGPGVALGDALEVHGTVTEFQPGDDSNLTTTEITASSILVESTGNPLPASVLIGAGGLIPPTETIEDDGFAVFDPANDGMDFYESLEGMRVTIESPLVISNTFSGGQTYVVASGGDFATGLSARGGLTLSDGDFNPERIQIDATPALFAGYTPNHSQGDHLSNITGIMSYSQNSYEVLVTEAVVVTQDVTLQDEVSTLTGDRDHLTFASYNVENMSPDDPASKFDLLAGNIVYSLNAPDILALQEVQDGNGLNDSDPLSGAVTAQLLIDAIAAIGGPHYVYVEIAPATANSTGGEPGGNIRPGFLYNADRVSYVDGSAHIIDAAAFNGSRKPLVADFVFNGEKVELIDVHFTSRLGSDPLWGADQPPLDAGDSARTAQGQAVAAYVNNALAADPSLKLGVMGDFNGFWFEGAVGAIEAAGLTDLHRLLPEAERYSYIFDGNLQAIDHMLVTGGLLTGAQFDAVHLNAEQGSLAPRGTDHDPILGRLFIEHPNEAPFDIALDGSAVDENSPAGTLVGTVTADDPDPEDALSYSLADDAGGRFLIDETTGVLTTTQPLDHEDQASWDVVVRVTDPHGLFTDQGFTIAVGDVNEAPVAAVDAVAVDEDATTDNLWSQLLGNDSDPDDGDSVTIVSVDSSGTLGNVVFDESTHTLLYVADNDAFDQLAPGATQVDHFTYTIADADGLTSTATVDVTVTGIDDGVASTGGNGADRMEGGDGEDELSGGNGADLLLGGAGHDVLLGGSGDDVLMGGIGRDRLEGGRGNDKLFGGQGADLFVFGKTGGADVVADYQSGLDQLLLQDGIAVHTARVEDTNGDGVQDLILAFTGGGSVTLLGVNSLAAVSFAGPADLANYPPF